MTNPNCPCWMCCLFPDPIAIHQEPDAASSSSIASSSAPTDTSGAKGSSTPSASPTSLSELAQDHAISGLLFLENLRVLLVAVIAFAAVSAWITWCLHAN